MNNLTTREWVCIIVWILLFFLCFSLGILLAIVIASVISLGGLFVLDVVTDSKSAEKKTSELKSSNQELAPPVPASAEKIGVQTAVYTSSPEVTALVDDAISIINEIMEIVPTASSMSDIEYSSTVFVIPTTVKGVHTKNDEYRFTVFMPNVSNLEHVLNKYTRWRNNPANQEYVAKLTAFAWKHRNNYNPSRNQYEIDTKTTVQIPQGKLPKIQAYLKDQIMKRCEMVVYRGDVMYHKDSWEANN